VSIQRDVNNPSLLLVANQISINNLDLQSDSRTILYGTSGLYSINADGPKEAARFIDIVEVLQPDKKTFYVVQRFCVRLIDRVTSITETITGDCNQLGLMTGSLSEARFTDIVSAVLINKTKIAVLEAGGNFLQIIGIEDDRVGRFAFYHKPTTIIKEPSTGMFLVFTNNGIETLSLHNSSLVASVTSRTGLAYTNDGLLDASTFTYISNAFYFGDTIIAADSKDHVIRVIDTVSNTVSSICQLSPLATLIDDVLTEASSISECTIASLYSVGIFPEHNFILLGGEKGLIKLHIRVNDASR